MPIVCQQVPGFFIDPAKLRAAVTEAFAAHGAIMQVNGHYGGLSLQSWDGITLEDAVHGSTEIVKKNEHGESIIDVEKYVKTQRRTQDLKAMTIKTQIASGILGTCVDFFADLEPFRSRLALMHAGWNLPFHVDTVRESWRVHIPVFTNPDCYFLWKDENVGVDEQAHMPADGRAWFARTDITHSFSNGGTEDRTHIVISLGKNPTIT